MVPAPLIWFLLAIALLGAEWLGAEFDGLLAALQRWSRRRERAIPASGASEQATVISGFTGSEANGRVRWQGQSWAANNLDPQRALTPGEAVRVMGRDGNRLQVLSEE